MAGLAADLLCGTRDRVVAATLIATARWLVGWRLGWPPGWSKRAPPPGIPIPLE